MPTTIDVATLRTILTADASQFNKEMEKAEGLGEQFGVSLQTIGKAAIGGGLALVTGAVAGIGAVVSKTLPMASEFADQIVGLELASRRADVGLETLREAALAVGADSRILGASASGAAEAMTGLFKSGLETTAVFGDMEGFLAGTAELGGALKAAFDLAAASELDVVEASDLAVIALSTLGGELETDAKKAEFVNHAMDTLVRAADASVAEVRDLGEALGMVGPTASALGFGIEETANALALLSTAGITGSRAGSNLDAMLRSLSDPTDAATDALKDLGLTLFDEAGEFKDLEIIVGEFEGALVGMNQEQRSSALGAIFTAQGQRSMNVLLQQGAEGWTDMADDMADATGIAEQSQARAATLSGQWEGFQGTLETLGIQIGAVFMPFAQQLIEWAGQLADQFGPPVLEWFQMASEMVLPLVERVGELLLSGGSLTEWLDLVPDSLMPVVNGIMKFVEAVTPLVEKVVAWLAENVKLQDVLATLGIAIGVVVVNVLAMIAPVVLTFAAVMAAVVLLRQAWENNWGDIQGKTKIVVAWLQENIPIAIEKAREVWEEKLLPALVKVYEFIRDDVIPIIEDVVAWLQENIPLAIAEAKRVWEEVLLPALTTVYEFIRDDVIPIIEDIVDWLEVNIPAAIEEARRVWEDVLLPALTKVWDFLDEYILPIVRDLVDIFVLELQIIIEVLAGLWEKTLLPALTSVWEFLDQNVLPIFRDLFGQLGTDLMPVLETVSAFLQGAFLTALTFVGDAVKNVADWIGTLLDKIREWRKTEVPEDFRPGSPPPLFYALQDINSAMAEMAAIQLPKLSRAWAAPTMGAGTMGAASLGDRMAGAIGNIDRSANVSVTANYANQQSESTVARDVQTVLDLMGWR